jgi:hypothetical protein
MRYFHRTALPPDQVLEEADQFLGGRLETSERAARARVYQGSIGVIRVTVRAEGGHYTLITASTDQVGESEADKLTKRFLGRVHQRHEPHYELRGAY